MKQSQQVCAKEGGLQVKLGDTLLQWHGRDLISVAEICISYLSYKVKKKEKEKEHFLLWVDE